MDIPLNCLRIHPFTKCTIPGIFLQPQIQHTRWNASSLELVYKLIGNKTSYWFIKAITIAPWKADASTQAVYWANHTFLTGCQCEPVLFHCPHCQPPFQQCHHLHGGDWSQGCKPKHAYSPVVVLTNSPTAAHTMHRQSTDRWCTCMLC